MTLLEGTRVLDLSGQIAGPYCTKMLADAGAEVVKLETADGDPLRRWSASGADVAGRDGALFSYLNAGKRSVVGELRSNQVAALLDGCDLVVEDGRLDDGDLAWLEVAHPLVSVVSVTPFGRTGPWRDHPATEFILQAACGSIGGRGTLEREPFHAGGRLGEWIGGTFAAVAALSALRGSRLRMRGDRVDISMLECMAIFMAGSAGLLASFNGTMDSTVPPRTQELPSIEPTADGYVGFCTVTGQQFKDFLVLIERPDLLDDAGLANFAGRYARRQEFRQIVWDWTTKRTTAEIEELASLLRIPVAPIGNPDTITELAQFVDRGVFGRAPSGFVGPRRPYRVDDEVVEPRFAAAPGLGEHTASAAWPARPSAAGESAAGDAGLPLAGLRIVDLTAFWAGPAATLVLGALGADIIKVEAAQRPDPMRFASARTPADPDWWEWGSVYQGNNWNKRGITIDLRSEKGQELLLSLVAESDALIENFSPRVLDNFGITWERVRAANPGVIMVRMPAFGLTGPWRDRTGFAQTMEQASGMAWMTGFADGPPVIPRGPCDPLAGMHAAFALLACLEERRRSGSGHVVESTMVESALNVAAEVVIERSAYGAHLHRDGNRGPVSAPQGIYACRSDDGRENWLAVAVPDDSAWSSLSEVIGSPAWASRPDLQSAAGRREAHDTIDKELSAYCAERDVEELAAALVARGVPAVRVCEPARVVLNPQLRARGFVETFDHRVIGRHETFGMPFRFGSYGGPWLRSPSPTVGEHNAEVFGALLGLSDADLGALREAGVIGTGPSFG